MDFSWCCRHVWPPIKLKAWVNPIYGSTIPECLQRKSDCTTQFIGDKGAKPGRYGKKAKLGHVTPHALRHSAAKLRQETGASIEDVGALLGHQNIATTAQYLARLEGTQDHGWYGVAEMLGVGTSN